MPDWFDTDTFEERAAICEFDGGMSRFNAETQAARQQGLDRWQALKLVKDETNANGGRHTGGSRDTDAEMAWQSRSNDMPGMQRQSEEKNRSVPIGQQSSGRSGLVLSALRTQGRGVL